MATIARCKLEGHLTSAQLEERLSQVVTRAPSRSTPPSTPSLSVLLDCREMVDYDLDARHAFVVWLKTHRPRKVAILTDRALWRMVIQTMSMASQVPLHPFADEDSALAWLEAG